MLAWCHHFKERFTVWKVVNASTPIIQTWTRSSGFHQFHRHLYQTLMAVQWSNVTFHQIGEIPRMRRWHRTSLDHAISVRTHPSILANLHPEVRDLSQPLCEKLTCFWLKSCQVDFGAASCNDGIYPLHTEVPSRELTYPTSGKGKSSSKCHFGGICYSSSLEGIRACPTWRTGKGWNPVKRRFEVRQLELFVSGKLSIKEGSNDIFHQKKGYPKSFRVFSELMRCFFWIRWKPLGKGHFSIISQGTLHT